MLEAPLGEEFSSEYKNIQEEMLPEAMQCAIHNRLNILEHIHLSSFS